jgi:hypothetical protein
MERRRPNFEEEEVESEDEEEESGWEEDWVDEIDMEGSACYVL